MSQKNSLQEQINSIISIYSDGQIQNALMRLELLTNDYPDEAVIYNIKGACFTEMGEFNNSIRNYETALAINPNYAEAYNNLGNAFREILDLKLDNCQIHHFR